MQRQQQQQQQNLEVIAWVTVSFVTVSVQSPCRNEWNMTCKLWYNLFIYMRLLSWEDTFITHNTYRMVASRRDIDGSS